MKTNIRILGFLFALFTVSVVYPRQASAQQGFVSMQVFYDELSPYGEWIDYPQYGYVWIPDAGSDFMPYSTAGRWINTNYGWTWVSDYPWGWAPFHYGRWDYDNYYGWFWVPDYEWGPSWVTWRSARGYYGWQPMRPGISISLSFGNDYYNNYNDYWMFVRDRDFQRPNVSRYYVNQTNLSIIIRNSTVINNTYIDNSRNATYVSGPAREDVQRNTGKRVSSFAIRENSTPGQVLKNGQLQIYRPNVRKSYETGSKPTPTRVTSREDIKRPTERNAINQQRYASPANNSRQQQQRQNNINQQNIDKGNAQRDQRQKENQSESNRQQQQRKNNINQQNIDKGNAQRDQQQKENQSESNRQQQQRKNNINQQNIDKGNAQRDQQQKENQSENNRQQQQQQLQNIDKNNPQPAQQPKVSVPQNNVREQRQIDRQEKSNRNKQEKENKNR